MKAGSSRRISSTSSDEPRESAPSEIQFYRANEKPYGVFSNLFQRAITFEGEVFATAEHAYQAGKARKKQVRDWILGAPTPGLVAMAAHGLYTWDIVPDWSRIKYDRMRAVLRAKFTQHADLRDVLLSTGDARLVEAGTVVNSVNCTWGEVNGKGKNMLGIMLMELRQEFREKPKSKAKRASRTTHKKGSGSRSVKSPVNGWPKGAGAMTV